MKPFNLLAVFLFISLGSHAQVNLTAGLVAYYPFNGNTQDASGNGNHATNFGATLTSDQWGNPNSAYVFNGTGDYMMVSSNTTLQPSGFTLCARVKPLSFYNGPCFNNVIMAKGNSAGYGNGDFALTYTPTLNQNPSTYCFIQDSTHEDYRVYAGSTGAANSLACITPVNGIPYITTNNWDCVIGTYDSATHTASVYVNGIFRYSYLIASNIGINNQDVYIGKQNSPGYEYYVGGVLDELRIYNRALNIQEIDSICNLVNNPTTVINQYAAVSAYQPCNNALTVDTATFFQPGDTVLLVQMKGAAIDSSNTATFGSISSYQNCGNYEINVVQSVVGNMVSLKNNLTRTYDFVTGKVQLVTVPTINNYSINITHTCMPWNGTKGGVFIINVPGTLTMNASIDVSGRGFRGGATNTINSNIALCNNYQYFDPPNIDQSAAKGEGITDISVTKSYARGKLANGGGGGNGHNGGGGGGSNAAGGGIGGYQHNGCNPVPVPNDVGGIGGLALTYNNILNKIFLGGGGGAGHSNNHSPTFPASNLTTSDGAPGGGLVLVLCGSLVSNPGASIVSNGGHGYTCNNTGVYGICHDGMGGGGGGGTVLLSTPSLTGNLAVSCKGGNGGNMSASTGLGQLGPGGGGSGGAFWYSGPSIPAVVNVNTQFGLNGVDINYSNDPWGAQSGQAGVSLTGLVIPVDTTVYVSSSNVANAGNDTSVCAGSGVQLNASGGVSYSWQPATSLSNPSVSNPVASPLANTTYTVTVTDANGCSDTDDILVTVHPLPPVTALATPQAVCIGDPVTLLGGGALNYSWSGGVSNGISFVPTATATYVVTGTDAAACSGTASVTVTVNNDPIITVNPSSVLLCLGDSIQLNASGAVTYAWSPNASISSTSLSNPWVYPLGTSTYMVTGADAIGCTGTASVDITVVTEPKLTVTKSGDVECNIKTVQLAASGANNYTWEPATFLSNPNAAVTNAFVNVPTTFVVTGTIGTCVVTDSIHVDVFNNDEMSIYIPNAFSPNGDGNNDCLHIRNTAKFTEYYFAIYNRWGQKVFETDIPDDCWNGQFKNAPAELGSYYYFLKAETKCGKIVKKGDITLLR